jgi:hypothetical protein
MRTAASFVGLATGLAVLMATGAAEPASARNRTEIEPGTGTITLRVYDYVYMDRPGLLAAEREAAAILAQAGVKVRWVDCPTSHAELDSYAACQSAWQANDFVLRLLPNTMLDSWAPWQDALGVAYEGDGPPAYVASVFYDRVHSLCQGGRAPLPVLLGRAMAHEIGHLLLGTHSHSSTGIMRARWFGEDLSLAGAHLMFTAEQSRQIKRRLAERVRAWQAEANVAGPGRQ